MMICFKNIEIELNWSVAFVTFMLNPTLFFLVLLHDLNGANSANKVTAQYRKQWIFCPERILAVLNEAFTSFLRLHFI
jgi:hypothetical protein